MKLIRKTFDGLKGMLSGMGLTFRYFVRLDQVITQQYPENRDTLKLPERSRGAIELRKDEAGLYKCTACGLCAKACPNASIGIEKIKDPETKKFRLVEFEYHLERCVVCGLCVDACNFEALKMGQQFENAVTDPSQLTTILNADDPAYQKWKADRAAATQAAAAASTVETKVPPPPPTQA